MHTFYPGPSKLYPEVEKYLQDAFQSGILQANHRSPVFMDMMQETIKLLHEKLDIPADYEIYFVSSATECWEIIAQSLIENKGFHLFNGNFGEKWYYNTGHIGKPVCCDSFGINTSFSESYEENIKNDPSFQDYYKSLFSPEITCLVQNETSNGTQISGDEIDKIRKITDAELIAVDATSSMAGVELDWQKADVWFASVQKCFGLPAGLAVLVCSPKAMEKTFEARHYNSLTFIQENHKKYQTHYTPNILGIYLLMRVMQEIEPIFVISEKIKNRAGKFYDFIEQKTIFKPLIKNVAMRSDTVIVVEGDEEIIKNLKTEALAKNIILGNGYGQWKDNTFRIANFPAIEDTEFEKLTAFLSREY